MEFCTCLNYLFHFSLNFSLILRMDVFLNNFSKSMRTRNFFQFPRLIKKEELTKLENEKKTLNVQLTKEVAKSAAALKAQKAAETERDAKKKEVDECNAKIEKAKDAFGSSGGSNQAKGNAQSGGANQAKGNGPFGGKNPNAATGTVGQANKLPRGNGGKIPAAPAAAGDKEEGDENNSS